MTRRNITGTPWVADLPEYVWNPITENREHLDELPEDGYKRRWLELLYAVRQRTDDTINLQNAPILTFQKDRCELRENEDLYALIKREPDSRFEELIHDELQELEL